MTIPLASPDPCVCLSTIGAKLAGDGHYIRVSLGSLFGGTDRPVFELYRTDTDTRETRRGRVRVLVPDFCPFCGLKYKAAP